MKQPTIETKQPVNKEPTTVQQEIAKVDSTSKERQKASDHAKIKELLFPPEKPKEEIPIITKDPTSPPLTPYQNLSPTTFDPLQNVKQMREESLESLRNPKYAHHSGLTTESSPVPTRATAIHKPIKEGWLTKRGHVIKNWKKRYFRLKDRVLFYYQNETSTDPLGKIQLDEGYTLKTLDEEENSSKPTSQSIGFKLVHPSKKGLIVFAESISQAEQWQLAIRDTIL